MNQAVRRKRKKTEEARIGTKRPSKDQLRAFISAIGEDEELSTLFREAVGAAGTIGKPKRRRRRKRVQGDEHAKKMSAMVGDVTHDEDFLPVPPDPIVQKAKQLTEEYGKEVGLQYMEKFYDDWEAGRLHSADSASGELGDEIESMVEEVRTGQLV